MKDTASKLKALLFVLEHSDDPVHLAKVFIAEMGGVWFGDAPSPCDARFALCMFNVTGVGDRPHDAIKDWMINARALVNY